MKLKDFLETYCDLSTAICVRDSDEPFLSTISYRGVASDIAFPVDSLRKGYGEATVKKIGVCDNILWIFIEW